MADHASTSADPALDFLSASFDPVLALSTPNLEPPDPDARPLDNVAKCRSILPSELPESLANVEKKTASEVGGSMGGAAGAWVGQCARYMERTSSHGMRVGCLACLLPHCLEPRSPPSTQQASRLKAGQFKERAARLAQRIQEGCQLSLERVVASIKPGPIRVLGQWMAAGMRVRVVTRHARGVRGVATGLLMAYDR